MSEFHCADIFGENQAIGRFVDPHFEVYSPHGLTQLIGYIKYHDKLNGPVFFRGQNKDYSSMKPSLCRETTNFLQYQKAHERLKNFVKLCNSKKCFMNNTKEIAYEPILQHYGISTEWLDVVDNLWTALWFASHTAYCVGKNGRYIHYEKSKLEFSYIFVLFFGQIKLSTSKFKKNSIYRDKIRINYQNDSYGFFETDKYNIIDLRYMTPSLYKRPHAQHAILAKRKSFYTEKDLDYKDTIVARIKIKTDLVHEWLGKGTLVDKSFVFPAPAFDNGYQILLENFPEEVPHGIGCLNIY